MTFTVLLSIKTVTLAKKCNNANVCCCLTGVKGIYQVGCFSSKYDPTSLWIFSYSVLNDLGIFSIWSWKLVWFYPNTNYTIDGLPMIQISQQNLFRAGAATGSMISSFFWGGSFSWNTDGAYQLSREAFEGEGFTRTAMIRSYSSEERLTVSVRSGQEIISEPQCWIIACLYCSACRTCVPELWILSSWSQLQWLIMRVSEQVGRTTGEISLEITMRVC